MNENTEKARALTELEMKIVEKGIQANALLSNPVFTDTVVELHAILKDAIAETHPHEQKKREMLYYMNAALTDLENLLKAAVAHRTQTEEVAEPDEPEQDNFE